MGCLDMPTGIVREKVFKEDFMKKPVVFIVLLMVLVGSMYGQQYSEAIVRAINECVSMLGKNVPSGFVPDGTGSYVKIIVELLDVGLYEYQLTVENNRIADATIVGEHPTRDRANNMYRLVESVLANEGWTYRGVTSTGNDVYLKNSIMAVMSRIDTTTFIVIIFPQ
jgi:hypothetical protein